MLEQSILLSSLELPEGAKILAADMEAVVVQCIIPVEMPEEGAAEAVPGEPEVIGAKAEEEKSRRRSNAAGQSRERGCGFHRVDTCG